MALPGRRGGRGWAHEGENARKSSGCLVACLPAGREQERLQGQQEEREREKETWEEGREVEASVWEVGREVAEYV